MEPKKFKRTKINGPEKIIQDAIIAMLTLKGWLTKVTHGNEFQSGLPDLYNAHIRYGTRWVEVKNPKAYSFTPAQIDFFPKLAAAGVGVWILVAATEDEYQKLFKPANWYTYLSIWKV